MILRFRCVRRPTRHQQFSTATISLVFLLFLAVAMNCYLCETAAAAVAAYTTIGKTPPSSSSSSSSISFLQRRSQQQQPKDYHQDQQGGDKNEKEVEETASDDVFVPSLSSVYPHLDHDDYEIFGAQENQEHTEQRHRELQRGNFCGFENIILIYLVLPLALSCIIPCCAPLGIPFAILGTIANFVLCAPVLLLSGGDGGFRGEMSFLPSSTFVVRWISALLFP